MANYTTISTSSKTADIVNEFILAESSTTRLIFKAKIVENPKDPEATISGYIIHQRKSKNNEWENIQDIKLNQLKSGEGVKFNLSCGETKKLFDALQESYALGKNGVMFGTKELVVEEASKIIAVPDNRRQIITTLLQQEYGEEVWEELISMNPDLASKLSSAKIQADRKESLIEFEGSLDNDKSESYWQKFFEKNQWIFGLGLKYQFLHLLKDQPHFGGIAVSGKGAQRGDFLFHTAAENKYTVLVEIKKPQTHLFSFSNSGELVNYRNGVPLIHPELIGAISQIQVNSKTWEIEGAKTEANSEELANQRISTINPKGILVIGHTRQLDSSAKRKAFELYRINTHNPEILTFDELYERAKYIVYGDHTNKIFG